MSKENALKFLIFLEQNKELGNKCKEILTKYEEILAIANENGFDFTLDEYKELETPAINVKLNDQELDNVVGGVVAIGSNHPIVIQCYLLSDGEQVRKYFESWPNDCPKYQYSANGPAVQSCCTCTHFTCRPR